MKSLQQQLALLTRHAAEAGSEPSFLWLPPFPAACYDKIQGSLGRMAQLLRLYHQARMAVGDDDDDLMMFQQQRRLFSSLVSSSLGYCLRMLQASPDDAAIIISSSLDHHQDEANKDDLEAGNNHANTCLCCCKEENTRTPEEVVASFLAHAREAAASLELDDDGGGDVAHAEKGEDRGLLVFSCLASMGLCMGEIIREAQRLEANIIDLNNLQRPHQHKFLQLA